MKNPQRPQATGHEPQAENHPRSPHLLIVDNYDSFTYNLADYLGQLGARLTVWRNDRFALEDIEELAPDGIVISPGPATPAQAGLSVAVIRRYSGTYPILGVCLGHQAIGEAFGGRVVRAPRPMHGKTSAIHHDGTALFRGLPSPFTATRYHSLMVVDVPEVLRVNAWVDEEGVRVVQGLVHREHPTFGVQFHPESILTGVGLEILRTFLEVVRA